MRIYACMYVCMYACMYVGMHKCIYAWMYVYANVYEYYYRKINTKLLYNNVIVVGTERCQTGNDVRLAI